MAVNGGHAGTKKGPNWGHVTSHFTGILEYLCWIFWGWLATPPACYRSLSGPSGPKCPGSVPRGVSRKLWAPGSGVSKKRPQSAPGVSGETPVAWPSNPCFFCFYFVLRLSLLFCAFLLSCPRILRVSAERKSLLFLGAPRSLFSAKKKKQGLEGRGNTLCLRVGSPKGLWGLSAVGSPHGSLWGSPGCQKTSKRPLRRTPDHDRPSGRPLKRPHDGEAGGGCKGWRRALFSILVGPLFLLIRASELSPCKTCMGAIAQALFKG